MERSGREAGEGGSRTHAGLRARTLVPALLHGTETEGEFYQGGEAADPDRQTDGQTEANAATSVNFASSCVERV